MYDSILVPTDGSDKAQKAIDHAIELATTFDSTIHGLYVIDIPGAPRTVYVRDDEEEIRQAGREYGQRVTGELVAQASEAGIDTVTAVKSGTPFEEISDYAEDEDIDLIVIGTGYRGKIGSLLGSTAERVVRTSKVPVTTIRQLENE
jgi:nucleotide-binding universal stress UspA family protein